MANIADRVNELPIWHGPVSIEPLTGGLSNQSFLVSERGQRFVVRLGDDLPFHHVDRQREIMITRAAYEAGFAPELVYTAPGVMVSRFIDGLTYAASDVQSNLERIATLVRRFHCDMPQRVTGPAFLFWPFHAIRDYARVLREGASTWVARLDDDLALAAQLEAAQQPLPIVFGHHDFLPANFIDDGERVWIIDYEYAGFSTAMFDLAGIASNAGFDLAQSQALLEQYFGAPVAHDVLRSHAAMQCASLLREAMWAMVSSLHMTTPGIDFEAYANENLARLDKALGRYRDRFT